MALADSQIWFRLKIYLLKTLTINKIIWSLLLIMTTFCSISQTKKDQLEILNNRVDSLNTLLSNERSSNLKKISESTNWLRANNFGDEVACGKN